MANNGGLPLELADGVTIVIRDLLNSLAGKDLRIVIRLCNGLRVVGPAQCERRIVLLFKECAPVVPTRCKEIEAVYKHDRLLPFRVCVVDLLLFMNRKICHFVLLWSVDWVNR